MNNSYKKRHFILIDFYYIMKFPQIGNENCTKKFIFDRFLE